VLVLSVRDDEDVKVRAFESGADDYVTKPFSTAELVARLKAIQRRQKTEPSTVCEVGALRIDSMHHEAALQGASLKLTPVEFALLKLLAINAGKVVTQAHILKEVWAGTQSHAGPALRVHVNHLRSKLRESSIQILNEPGIGYRLVNVAEKTDDSDSDRV
jgi:two-component system KDP operon response regulator KdpE